MCLVVLRLRKYVLVRYVSEYAYCPAMGRYATVWFIVWGGSKGSDADAGWTGLCRSPPQGHLSHNP